jgi:hypothetical protein
MFEETKETISKEEKETIKKIVSNSVNINAKTDILSK